MIETLSFRTQARTVDHLGREQIADCPTAISELWKNELLTFQTQAKDFKTEPELKPYHA